MVRLYELVDRARARLEVEYEGTLQADPRLDRYGVVLALLTLWFVLGSTGGSEVTQAIAAFVGLATLYVALRTSGYSPTLRTAVLALVGVLTLVGVVDILASTDTPNALSNITQAFLFLFVAVIIGVRIALHRDIRGTTILGAIDVYVLLGFMFATSFEAIQELQGTPFFEDRAGDGSRADFLYFAFVTLSTLGYGDFTPATQVGRTLAVVLTVAGQLYLVTLLGRLVSMVGSERPRRFPNRAPETGTGPQPVDGGPATAEQ